MNLLEENTLFATPRNSDELASWWDRIPDKQQRQQAVLFSMFASNLAAKTVNNMLMTTLLSKVWDEWCSHYDFPKTSADELLATEEGLSEGEQCFIRSFINVWDGAYELEEVILKNMES